ncbi:MAG TPA: glycosyltransferase, partial [Gemmatirosa sp.]|nr:glycosyltransferase [Gemmatirosa sp.]
VDDRHFAPPPAGEPRCGLLFVGRLSRQKGLDVLLRALAQLPAGAALSVVGEGPDGPALRELAASLGVAARVRWLGALPQRALAPLYARAAVVVVPSREEGLGLVAVEAQLCGAPVVAADSGGLPDLVRHDRTGLLVRPEEPAALCAALRDLLQDPARAARLGAAGREAALTAFTPAGVAARYHALYVRVTAP